MKKKLCLLVVSGLLLLSGCTLNKDTKLPDTPPNESSHNSSSHNVSMPEHEPATLDEGFVDDYVDTKEFESGKNTVKSGNKKITGEYESKDRKTEKDIKNNKEAFEQQKNNQKSDIEDIKENAKENYEDAKEEAEKDIKEQ